MKQLYLCLIISVFCFNYQNAQTVSVSGSCYYLVDGDYSYDGEINGKPSFYHSPEGTTIYLISWTGTRWELTAEDVWGSILIASYNNLNTPNPPATSLLPWTPDGCNPAGLFSGDGTSTTMNTPDYEREKFNIYPIPSTDFLTISGLLKREHYVIYNVFGKKILDGTINNYDKIDIQNYPNGIYFIRFGIGQSFKFIKN